MIFNVITSPDTDKAQYWGHMPDTLTVGGVTLHRPLLMKEAPAGATDSRKENNETWVSVYTKADGLTYDMSKNCGGVAGFPAKGVLEKYAMSRWRSLTDGRQFRCLTLAVRLGRIIIAGFR